MTVLPSTLLNSALVLVGSLLIYPMPTALIRRYRPRATVQGTDPNQLLAARCHQVLDSLLTLVDADEPHVLNGEFSWYRARPIAIVFLDLNLVVQVHGPEIGYAVGAEGQVLFTGDEAINTAAARLRKICRDSQTFLVEVYWDTPVSPDILKDVLIAGGMEFASDPPAPQSSSRSVR